MSTLRITGGRLRGRRIAVAPGTRPTSEKVREALFSQLGTDIEQAAVLDCYCASGAFGIDALSRGAASCHFVDASARSLRVLRRNLAALELGCASARRRLPTQELPSCWPECFDIVFADPPYAADQPLMEIASALASLVAPGGVLYLEHSKRHPQAQAFLHGPGAGARASSADGTSRLFAVRQREYGETMITSWRDAPAQ